MTDVADIQDVKNRSVAAADVRGGTFWFHFWSDTGVILPYELPGYGSRARDAVMRSMLRKESNWASAVTIASTQMASRGWEVSSTVDKYVQDTQDLLNTAQYGRGWIDFVVLVTRDYLETDGGAHIEIVREDPTNWRSPIRGIVHLDSLRCWYSGEEDTPIWYEARDGYHRVPWWNIISVASMMDPEWPVYGGRGNCAASRCYSAVHKLYSLERLARERISGFRPQVMDIITGITTKQVETAIAQAKSQAQGQGYTQFLASALIGIMTDTPVNHTRLSFADLPPGYNVKEEREDGQLQIANNVGIQPTELNMAAFMRATLGSTGQALILDRQMAGREMELLARRLVSRLNWFVLNSKTTFAWIGYDLQDEQRHADIRKTNAGTVDTNVRSGVITPAEGKQLLAHWQDIPPEFLEQDDTLVEDATAEEKPEMVEDTRKQPLSLKQDSQDMVVLLVQQEMDAAIALYEEVMSGRIATQPA